MKCSVRVLFERLNHLERLLATVYVEAVCKEG